MTVPSEWSFDARINSWSRQIDPTTDFPARIAGGSTFVLGRRKPSSYRRNLVFGSPVVVEAESEEDIMSIVSTTATLAVPALTRGGSTVSSASSAADTDRVSKLEGGYVLESRDGVLTVPNRFRPDADLLCPFQILDCREVFSEIVDFKTHVFSHFKGHNAPKTASCFLCDKKFSQSPHDHAAMSWNKMLSHLANEHFRQGQRLATVRTDFGLMRWMYVRRIIDDAEFKRTQMCPVPVSLPTSRFGEIVNTPFAPMPPPVQQAGSSRLHMSVGLQNEAFTVSASRRTERRHREATRAAVRNQGHL